MDRWDVTALIGIVLLGCGLWLLAPWLGLFVTGAVLLGAGLWLLAPWLGLTTAGAVLLGVGLFGSVLTERAAARQELINAKKGGA